MRVPLKLALRGSNGSLRDDVLAENPILKTRALAYLFTPSLGRPRPIASPSCCSCSCGAGGSLARDAMGRGERGAVDSCTAAKRGWHPRRTARLVWRYAAVVCSRHPSRSSSHLPSTTTASFFRSSARGNGGNAPRARLRGPGATAGLTYHGLRPPSPRGQRSLNDSKYSLNLIEYSIFGAYPAV